MRVTTISICLGLLAGCGDKDAAGDSGTVAGTDDTGEGAEDTDWPEDQNCPDGTPEEYELIWDCSMNTCDSRDDIIVYKLAWGASTETGIEVTEQFWVFDEDKDWCVDEFELVGEPETEWNVDTFNCTTCEQIWRVERTHTVQDCGYGWTSTLNDKGNDSGVFNAVIMFDTHNSFGDRNPDDASLVYMVNFDSDWDDWDKGRSEWARGTNSPTSSEDGPPEDVSWVSSGACY